MQKLSGRLQAAADFVTPGYRVADIGTDHGFLPIYLVQSGKCPGVTAMDIRTGPLERAKEHIWEAGLSAQIQTRLSDGLDKLSEGEAESIVITGMGGLTVIQILEAGIPLPVSVQELVLGPQSDLAKVRRYLREHGMHIDKENLIFEDGKFYPILHVELGQQEPQDSGARNRNMDQALGRKCSDTRDGNMNQAMYGKCSDAGNGNMDQVLGRKCSGARCGNMNQALSGNCIDARYGNVYQVLRRKGMDDGRILSAMDRYGECMLCKRHPVLQKMLKRDEERAHTILQALEGSGEHGKNAARRNEVEMELEDIRALREVIG